jgi:hypothetical protein
MQVTGVCNEISERSGWQTFHIDKGTQYPVKLATKKEEVIAAARAVGQQVATWTYNEVISDKINEHTGQPFVNRYLEGVEAGGTPEFAGVPHPQAQTAVSTPTHAPLPPGDKDRAITRMAVLKAAAEVVASLELGPDDDPAAETIALASRFETWVYRDVDDLPF